MTLLQDAGWIRDMKDAWKEVISKNRPDLCKMIDTEGDFIDHLEGLKVFNNRTCQSFKSKTGRYSQVSVILTALSKRPFEDFVKFCQALEKSNQGHVISHCLSLNPVPTELTQADARPGGDEAPSNHPLMNVWRDLIRDNYPMLVSEIDPDHGLFTYLVGKKVIMDWMQDTFLVKTGRSNRAAAILDHLILKRPFEDFLKFCDALVETNQKHVVDKYFSLGRPNTDQSDVGVVDIRPHVMDSRQGMLDLHSKYKSLRNLDWKATFVETRSSLVENIDASNDFINLLLGLGIFNAISFEACQEREDIFQRVEFILDYMRRRPDEDFFRFCYALERSNQDHVIKILLKHRIDRPPSVSLSPQLQPGTRGGEEGENKMPIKEVFHPVDDSEPMEQTQIEGHQQCERGFDVLHLGQHQGLVTHQQQQETSCNAVPQAPQSINLHPPLSVDLHPQNSIDLHPQNSINLHPLQQVICHPQDVEEGEIHQTLVIPNPVGNAVANHEAANVQIIEDSDRGPVEIKKVDVKLCNGDFYKMYRNTAYPMCRRVRGRCVIVNNKIVDRMTIRNGTEKDGQLLKDLFHQLHFQVEELNNCAAEEIKQKMKNFSKEETLRNDQCLVLFLLSHGETIVTPAGPVDCIYGSDGVSVTVNEILEPLTDANCPQLRNKPKLVFFQACRGDFYQDQTQTDAPPVFRDFLVGYPTQKDYRSFRNTIFGSWYINAVVQVFAQRACDTSLSELMNLVTGKVAAWTTDTGHPDSHQKGQTATYTSHLTKSLYFFPGIVMENDNR